MLRAPIDRVTVLPFVDAVGEDEQRSEAAAGFTRSLELFDIKQAQCSEIRDSAHVGSNPRAPREPLPKRRDEGLTVSRSLVLSSAAQRLRGCIEAGFGTHHAFNQVVRRIFVEKRDAIHEVMDSDAPERQHRTATGVRKWKIATRRLSLKPSSPKRSTKAKGGQAV